MMCVQQQLEHPTVIPSCGGTATGGGRCPASRLVDLAGVGGTPTLNARGGALADNNPPPPLPALVVAPAPAFNEAEDGIFTGVLGIFGGAGEDNGEM